MADVAQIYLFTNYTCDLYQIFGACCLLLSWLDLSLAKGAKSAIYDCLVKFWVLLYIVGMGEASLQI